jgi:hypothetical protein
MRGFRMGQPPLSPPRAVRCDPYTRTIKALRRGLRNCIAAASQCARRHLPADNRKHSLGGQDQRPDQNRAADGLADVPCDSPSMR